MPYKDYEIVMSSLCESHTQQSGGYTPPLKIPLISLWRWVARRPYKVLSVISTNIAWYTHIVATFPSGSAGGSTIDLESNDAEFDAVILETEFMKVTIFFFPIQTSTNVTEKSFLQ